MTSEPNSAAAPGGVPEGSREFRLPDVGEGLTESEIVAWLVAPGDRVEENQVLVEIETAKARVELPSPFAGVVGELLVREGETVAVGTPLVRIDPPAAEREPPAPATLVGYGPRPAATARRPRPGLPGETAAETPARAPGLRSSPSASAGSETAVADVRVRAKPPVRFLARERGVDLSTVTPTGPARTITRDDVLAAATIDLRDAVPALGRPAPPTPAVRPTDRRVTPSAVRRATAAAMSASVAQAPQAATWLTVDVTRSVKLLDRLRADPAFTAVPVSPLLVAVRALVLAAARHPEINATWDATADGGRGEIVLHADVNVGVAVSTPRGLLVPVVHAAQTLGLHALASALDGLARTARAGDTQPSDLVGGTVTVTNVGTLGVDGGVPLLYPGQAAILCLGRVASRPWVHKGKVRPRPVVELTLTFDHRLVDGDLAAGVLADVAAVLEDPVQALTWS